MILRLSQPMVSRCAPAFLALTAALSLCFQWQDTFAVQGVVLRVAGSSTAVLAKTSRTLALSVGQKLPPGSIVRCPAGGEVFLALTPGVVLQLRGRSELKLGSLKIKKRDAETEAGEAEITLSEGSAVCSVQARGTIREAFLVKTPSDSWAANGGTLFTVSVNAERASIVCAAGVIQSQDGERTVPAGYFYEKRSDGSRDGENFTDAEAQLETMKMLEASTLLASLSPERLTLAALFPQ